MAHPNVDLDRRQRIDQMTMRHRGDWSTEACLDSLDFPLPFTDCHVTLERSTWDSPSLLSTGLFDFLRQSPPSIPRMLASTKIQVVDEDEGAERGEMRNSWGWGPLDVIWVVGEGESKG